MSNEHTTVRNMGKEANWSELCEQDRCLAKVPHFAKYLYFLFPRRIESKDGVDAHTECHVKDGCKDEWRPMRVINGVNQGFLLLASRFAQHPSTSIICTISYDEVRKRIESEESRIKDAKKLPSLYELVGRMFITLGEPSHWDLDNADEQGCADHLEEDEMVHLERITEDPAQMTIMSTDELVNKDLDYALGSYVAVKPNKNDNGAPFWVAKVLLAIKKCR